MQKSHTAPVGCKKEYLLVCKYPGHAYAETEVVGIMQLLSNFHVWARDIQRRWCFAYAHARRTKLHQQAEDV